MEIRNSFDYVPTNHANAFPLIELVGIQKSALSSANHTIESFFGIKVIKISRRR